MRNQAVEPGQLVVEFRAWLRVAVRQIDAGDEHAPDGRLDIPALRIVGIAGEGLCGDDRRRPARQDGDAVPGTLTLPYRLVAEIVQGTSRKLRLLTFELLQADDIRLRRLEPGRETAKALVDVVDVEGRDLHGVQL